MLLSISHSQLQYPMLWITNNATRSVKRTSQIDNKRLQNFQTRVDLEHFKFIVKTSVYYSVRKMISIFW